MSEQKNSFEAAGGAPKQGTFAELVAMLRQNKKYWLIPMILALLLFGVLILLGASSAAPFIYTLF
jgi:drug/metabolite transporter superfamily protein YnfA